MNSINPKVFKSYIKYKQELDPEKLIRLSRICKHCEIPFGGHQVDSNQCPTEYKSRSYTSIIFEEDPELTLRFRIILRFHYSQG